MMWDGPVRFTLTDQLSKRLLIYDKIYHIENGYPPLRCKSLADRKLLYIGTGVSGGEEGARYGPSIMPGGNPDAWPLVKDILQVN